MNARSTPHLLIIEARFYDDMADTLLAGATKALETAGATFDVVTVMGALEIPAAVSMAMDAAEAGGTHYDGYVALAVVIRGETYHFELVSNESVRGLMNLSVAESLAIGNAIMTVENAEQAWERISPDKLDKGGFAARAALTMIALRQKLETNS